ncbi:phasin family protein [Usitatibacter palustris]|uniref:Poly(Hydroxyalkanoate) granule-associated protein n=1 Tax=Usitatibacter palustris TaxID=2732487 RepID=A0A6M4H724_9PROT|nr:phasin family protein [Usitatibacter palustris]QJR15182.1 hypothetical protein DSM104440_01999 [Usitatibacter palustris]
MASKTKSRKRTARATPEGFPQSVAESAQKIWLAGLGAFARARSEGDKMFELLVERGQSLRGQARTVADQAFKNVRAQADATAATAAGKWDKLEQVFEERVARSLGRLGVLTNKDIDALAKQVEQLNASLKSLSGGSRKAPAKKKAATRKARK